MKNWLPPKNWLPQKLVTPKKICYPKKNWLPQKKWLPQKNDQKKYPKKMACFIARGVIIEFWKNGVLYFVRVY